MNAGGFDPVELRRRIVFAFSAAELMRLAEELGVAGLVRWDRGPQEAAHDIVRQFEKGYGGLPTLVDKLRQVKPLVEWPEPSAPGPTLVDQGGGAGGSMPPSIQHGFSSAPLLASPGSLGGPAAPQFAPPQPASPTVPGAPAFAPQPPQQQPYAAQQQYTTPQPYAPPQPPFAPPQQQPQGPVSSAGAPPSAPWPGTFQPAQPKSSTGIDPRILIAVAGLMVVGALIAYFAGRASSPQVAVAPRGDSTSSGVRRPDGPATHIADAFNRRIENVARACEVRMGSPSEVFARSLAQCGGQSASPRPSDTPRGDDPSVAPRPAPTARPSARDDRPRAAGPADARPREAPGGGCLKGCAGEQGACKSRCGGEPSEASKYGDYQACMGRCTAQFSKCRLGCP